MMKKPDNWDVIEGVEAGSFPRLPIPAIYECIITKAEEATSQAGNQCIDITVDIATGEYKNFFEDAMYPPTLRQGTEGSSLPFFKGVITAIEQSNKGYKFDFNPSSLIGKKCVGVFGERQANNGNIYPRLESIRSIPAMKEGKIEVPKPIERKPVSASNNSTNYNPIPEDIDMDSDLPF